LISPYRSPCSESNKANDIKLPEFHRLVNYPDYLAKSRTASPDANSAAAEGKKNCVMCGKQRFCSVSSLVNKGRFVKREGEDDGADHIIPRQNKGLCTACDVTVWMVTNEGVEIKWCKGCKNFRPWAAFGDKGSATKCVRCRDRQREKYAMQKDEIKLRRYKQTGSAESSPTAQAETSKWDDRTVEEQHMAAANGLRNLIHAAATH
jgi:Zn-finger nucleic acid-binding protein